MSLLAAARAQALAVLASPVVTTKRIHGLKKRLKRGTFNGRSCENCFFGILGGGTLGGYNSLRQDVGMETPPSVGVELNPIEAYCLGIYRGSRFEMERSRLIVEWIDLELARRASIRWPNRSISTSVSVSVTEAEINEALDSFEADRLIAETRLPEMIPASV